MTNLFDPDEIINEFSGRESISRELRKFLRRQNVLGERRQALRIVEQLSQRHSFGVVAVDVRVEVALHFVHPNEQAIATFSKYHQFLRQSVGRHLGNLLNIFLSRTNL